MSSGKGTSSSSLYAGIFNNKNRDAATASASPGGDDKKQESGVTASNHPPSTASTSSNTPAAPAWSAALRFAPRSKSSSSATRPSSSRPPPKISASFASKEPEAQDVQVNPAGSSRVDSQASSSSSGPGSSGWNRVGSAPSPNQSQAPATSQLPSSTITNNSTLKALTSSTGRFNSKLPPRNFSPPPLTLPEGEFEKDKALVQAQKAAMGEEGGTERGGNVFGSGYGEDERDRERWDDEEGEEDVNGFGDTREGKKSKKRKKRNRNQSPDRTAMTVNYDADYDYRVPNDYMGYKEVVKDRRAKEMDRRREAGEDDYDRDDTGFGRGDRDNYSAEYDSAEEEEKRRKMKRFAPPSSYGNSSRQGMQNHQPCPLPTQQAEEDLDALVPDDSPPPERHTLGSFSFSSGPRAPFPGPPAAPTFVSSTMSSTSSNPLPPPSGPPPSSETGEEAYARRVAMSQAASGEEAYQRRLAMSRGAQGQPPPPTFQPAAPPSAPSSSSDPSSVPVSDLAARQKAAAAAIAARLGKALAPQPPIQSISAQALADAQRPRARESQTSEEVGPSSVQDSNRAAALMNNWGYKQGEGLGSEGNKGITEPLSALKAKAEASRKKGNNWSSKSNPQAPARGTIVNTNVSEREVEERQRFGEPSQVILLEGMVTEEDVDDELPEEIGEECSKHGIVQRVFIWPGTPKGVRIFVVFSGMVGAWKAVRELDGRYFSGRTTRARYYPKSRFDSGDYLSLMD